MLCTLVHVCDKHTPSGATKPIWFLPLSSFVPAQKQKRWVSLTPYFSFCRSQNFLSRPTSLGKRVLIEVDKKPLPLFPEDSWFPCKVKVKSLEEDITTSPSTAGLQTARFTYSEREQVCWTVHDNFSVLYSLHFCYPTRKV